MKFLLILMISIMFSGCYVPYPSIGVPSKPHKMEHQKRCTRDARTGVLYCDYIRVYSRRR